MVLKTLPVDTFGITLACLLPSQFARAQQQAPIGHRQPMASDVLNLSGDPPRFHAEEALTPWPRPNNIPNVPNICYNCSQ